MFRDGDGYVRPGVIVAGAAVPLAAMIAGSLGLLVHLTAQENQVAQDVSVSASQQLGQDVTASPSRTIRLSPQGWNDAVLELRSQQTGTLVGLASLAGGDPVSAAKICPVDATDFDAAYQALTDPAGADEMSEVTFVCVDGKWGLQATPLDVDTQFAGLANKVAVYRDVTSPAGPVRQAGPAFGM